MESKDFVQEPRKLALGAIFLLASCGGKALPLAQSTTESTQQVAELMKEDGQETVLPPVPELLNQIADMRRQINEFDQATRNIIKKLPPGKTDMSKVVEVTGCIPDQPKEIQKIYNTVRNNKLYGSCLANGYGSDGGKCFDTVAPQVLSSKDVMAFYESELRDSKNSLTCVQELSKEKLKEK